MGAEGGKPEAPSRPAALLEAALAAFFALGAAALFLAMPRLIAEGGIPSSQDFVTLSPIAFPRLTFGVLVFLGLFYLAPSVRQVAVARPTGEGFSAGKLWNVLAMAGWVILYAALVPWLGYGAATLLVTAGVTFFLGGRRWWQFLPIALLSPLAIRFIFERLLLISLPRGAFEPLAAAEDALLKLLTQLLFWG